METKVCSKCKQEKPLTAFFKSKRDGYRSRCKECHKADCAEYAKTGYYNRYNKTQKNLDKVKERRDRPEARIKNLARWYAKRMVAKGVIEKQACALCGAPEAQKHHPDYDKPLLIVWLCRDCHRELHNKLTPTGEVNSR